jgi:hypothetical protein
VERSEILVKLCAQCKEVKDFDQYSKHRGKKYGLRSWCKSCESNKNKASRKENPEYHRARMAKWSKDNPEKRKANQRKVTNARKQIIREAKSGPCVDCDTIYPPECMDLDHVRGIKEFCLSKGHAYSKTRILAEIAKCELRCPTCHRLRHYHEREKL